MSTGQIQRSTHAAARVDHPLGEVAGWVFQRRVVAPCGPASCRVSSCAAPADEGASTALRFSFKATGRCRARSAVPCSARTATHRWALFSGMDRIMAHPIPRWMRVTDRGAARPLHPVERGSDASVSLSPSRRRRPAFARGLPLPSMPGHLVVPVLIAAPCQWLHSRQRLTSSGSVQPVTASVLQWSRGRAPQAGQPSAAAFVRAGHD